MPALRASYSIEPEALRKFNEMAPPGERSQVLRRFTEKAPAERDAQLEAIATEYETHPDFGEARSDGKAFEATSRDGPEPGHGD